MDALLYDKIDSDTKKILAAISSAGGEVDFSAVRAFVADYANDPVTTTYGAVDKYHRRIIGT